MRRRRGGRRPARPHPDRTPAAATRGRAVPDGRQPPLRRHRRRNRAGGGRSGPRPHPPGRRPARRRSGTRPGPRHRGQQRRAVAELARPQPAHPTRGHIPGVRRVRHRPRRGVVRRGARNRHAGRRPGRGAVTRARLSAPRGRDSAPARLGQGEHRAPAQRGRHAEPGQNGPGTPAPPAPALSEGHPVRAVPGARRARLRTRHRAAGMAGPRAPDRGCQRLRLRRHQRPRRPGGTTRTDTLQDSRRCPRPPPAHAVGPQRRRPADGRCRPGHLCARAPGGARGGPLRHREHRA